MKRGRILVVDDEPDLLELVRHQLQKEHYEVTTAQDDEVALAGKPIACTLTEFKLLHFLASNRGRAFTRNDLLNAVVGQDAIIIDRNVDVHVATLRKKLGEYGGHILTIRGLGYKFRETPIPAS